MTNPVSCPNCQSKLNVNDEWAGKKVRCKKCSASFVIPSVSDTRQVNPKQIDSARTSPGQRRLTAEEILVAIRQQIEPVPTTVGYQAALVGVTSIMMILPLIYLGLVLLVAAGAVAYAYYGLGMLSAPTRGSRGGIGKVLLYIGPLVASVIVVVFMFKPFFARSKESTKVRSLDRQSEPLLFAFVERLCNAVHAPVPKRIDIDSQVNASASFRRGLISLFHPNDLVLTIGMPLVCGLTIRELGGVLAHEFGHFSQSLGLRLTYIVRSINHWFARVVYQRDVLDEWLASTASSLDIRIGIVLYFAMFMVWLTRGILWIFMMIANGLSCFLMRQMEFDADLHEIRFAGSAAFESTSKKLRCLGVAFSQSLVETQGFLVDGKLVDNLPRLVQMNRDSQDAATRSEIEKSASEEKSNWFDTHPIDSDRIAAARKLKEPGVFQLEAPAQCLFAFFPAHCKLVSKDFFEEVFGDELKEKKLVEVEQLTTFKNAEVEAKKACARFFGPYFLVPRMITFASPSNRGLQSDSIALQIQKTRHSMIDGLSSYMSDSKAFDEADTNWQMCQQVSALESMGVSLKQADWPKVQVQSSQAIQQSSNQYVQWLAELHDRLSPFELLFAQRVDASIQMLHATGKHTRQATLVLQCLSSLSDAYGVVARLRNDFASISTIFPLFENRSPDATQAGKLMESCQRIANLTQSLRQSFDAVPYPFEHAKGDISMAIYLMPKVPKADEYGEVLVAASTFLSHFHHAYFRSIGYLATMVQEVELQLGMPAQNDAATL
jgi:predicted Zn finger-like uncharacterized protein